MSPRPDTPHPPMPVDLPVTYQCEAQHVPGECSWFVTLWTNGTPRALDEFGPCFDPPVQDTP